MRESLGVYRRIQRSGHYRPLPVRRERSPPVPDSLPQHGYRQVIEFDRRQLLGSADKDDVSEVILNW
jgi:hypothetical protein